ncbi:hypothetical protein J3F84DRAFT_339236 [Trichoderma pleuroticola]
MHGRLGSSPAASARANACMCLVSCVWCLVSGVSSTCNGAKGPTRVHVPLTHSLDHPICMSHFDHPSYLSMAMSMSMPMSMWLLKRVRGRETTRKSLTIQPVIGSCGVREARIANHGHTRRLQSCVSSAASSSSSFFPFLLRQIPSLPLKILLTATPNDLYKPYLSLYLLDLIPPCPPVRSI